MSKQAPKQATKEAPHVSVSQFAPTEVLFGWEKLPTGRYLAVRVKGGKRSVVTPKRHGEDWGESFALTVQRTIEAMKEET